jgi:3-methyl-2-oxobutanoate hydroxymethyltransferase
VHHTRATRQGVKQALLVADLPFGSYQSSTAQAVDSAVALMKAGAEAVKLEGDYPEAVSAMVRAGIPVMGHVGFTPQSVNKFGGHKVQGKGDGGNDVLNEALSLEAAGVFGIVFELVPAALAKEASEKLKVPTIGIGAGAGCDGQIQVIHDVLGLLPESYKHAKAYVDGRGLFGNALETYTAEVRAGEFPGEENSF